MEKKNYYYVSSKIIENFEDPNITDLEDIYNYSNITKKVHEIDSNIELNNQKFNEISDFKNNISFKENGIFINNSNGINNIIVGSEENLTNHTLDLNGSAKVSSLYLSDGSFILFDEGLVLNNNDNSIKISNNSIDVNSNNINIGTFEEIDNKLNVEGNINLTGELKYDNNAFIKNNKDNLDIIKKNINFNGNLYISDDNSETGGLSIGSRDDVGNGNLKINKNIINKFDKNILDLSTENKLIFNPSPDSPDSTVINGDLSIISNGNRGGLSIGISEYNAGDGNLVVTNNSNVLKKINIGSFDSDEDSLNIHGSEGINENKIDNHSNIKLGKYSHLGQTASNENQITVLGNNVKAFRNNLLTSQKGNIGYRAIALNPEKGIEIYTNNSETEKYESLENPNITINNDGQILKKLNIIENDNNDFKNSNNIINYVKKTLINQPPGTVIEFLTNSDMETHTYKAIVTDKMTIRIFQIDLINNKTVINDIGI